MALTLSPPSADDNRGSVPSSLLTAKTGIENGRVVVELRGEADASARPVLCDALSRAIAGNTGDVLVDLADVTFLDAGSGRVLAIAKDLLEQSGRALILRSPSTMAGRVLPFFGMSHLVEARTGKPGSHTPPLPQDGYP
jgi:anti-anti-sigma factor